ncbi:transcription factor Ouib-like isoform X3 [Bactrocera dorsalis]|uniref:Transcription factor Ouib-like isoform X3 n=1 Tax=Bactrocera dorsalis TaxID=27457 RepID=A0ABM3K6T5_BACDO|nr:transcription factor Ouib-like isoform X3 [Bactrocera dorsalis]
MEHKIILKCRTCLEENEEDSMFELFMENDINVNGRQKKLKLSKKFEYCCGVRIRESTDMPSKVCWKCFEMTRIWYNFRQMCMNSQLYLESLCEDRMRPEGADDAELLGYLMAELQVHRDKVHGSSESLESDTDDDDDNNDLGLLVDEDDDCAESENNLERNVKLEAEQMDEIIEELQVHRDKVHGSSESLESDTADDDDNNDLGLLVDEDDDGDCIEPENNLESSIKLEAEQMDEKNFTQNAECIVTNNTDVETTHENNKKGTKSQNIQTTLKFSKKLDVSRRRFCRSEKHRHERVYTNTRPYLCDVCGKSFKDSTILKNHSKLHTGKKDFNCMFCQKAFTHQHQLKAHLQTKIHRLKEAHYVSEGYEVVYE